MKKLHLIVLSLLSMIFVTSCDKGEEISDNESNEIEESTKLYYVKDDMEGMDMITDNVNRIFFIGTDSLTQGKIIKGCKMDTNSDEWIEEEAFVVYVDALNRITSILMKDWMCNFYNHTETTCDIVFINGDGTYESVENVPFVENKSNNMTRSVSGEEFIDGTLKVIGGVKSSLELALSVCKNPKSLETAFNAFDYISGLFSVGVSFGMNSASMGLKTRLMNIKPDLFSLCVFLIESGRTLSDFLTKQLIGNWELEYISVEQIDAKTAEVIFNVSGIKDNPSVKLNGNVWYMNTDNRDANTITFNVENNTYKLLLPLNSYGRFTGSITINGEFGFFKRKEFKFNVYNLELDRYEIEDDPLYKDGVVNFKMNIFLKGSENEISNDIKDFGYYIQFANDIDYHKVEHLSTIFESTPLTLELPIKRDGFFEQNTSIFEAVATEHYIGVYLVLKNGNIISYDHQKIKGLKYTKRPSLTFTGANVINTISEEYEDGYITYSTKHTISYNIEGAFWLDNLNFGLAEGYSDEVGTREIENGDGAYSGTYYLNYSNEAPSFYLYLLGNLYFGGNIMSNNKLVFNGIPVVSISIVGNSSRSLSTRTYNLNKEYGRYYSK